MRIQILAALVGVPLAAAFVSKHPKAASRDAALRLSPDEEQRAAALSDYLAKVHEEKLRAIRQVEEKKAQEIKTLKDEMEELKKKASLPVAAITTSTTASSSLASQDLNSLSKEQLIQRLLQYQRFMADYIVKAQEQKIRAVKIAEFAMKQKMEERFLLHGTSAPAAAAAAAASSAAESTLYSARNAAVAAAAAVGKSRWGDEELKRVGVVNVGAAIASQAINGAGINGAAMATPPPPPPPPAASRATTQGPVPPEVEAADHGHGGVGGLSLAQRVALGANAGVVAVARARATAAPTPAAPGTSATRADQSLYQRRNAKVLAAAAAGQSRWGPRELEHLQSLASLPRSSAAAAVPPEVVAADHGHGGVGGLSLADRVALGAKAGAVTGAPAATAKPAIETLYQRRNIQVLAAAAAGKSRWGPREIARVQSVASLAPRPATILVAAGRRVNVGASILLK